MQNPVFSVPRSLVVSALLLAACSSHAQIVSNLGEATSTFPIISTAAWRATSFTTDGLNYTLNSVTLSLLSADIPAGNVTPHIFADASGVPSGSALETFGSQTIGASVTFTSTGLSLSANTTYWLVLQATGLNSYWKATSSQNQTSTGSWTIGNNMLRSTDSGATWPTTDTFIGKFSVQATPVPEPEHYAAFTALLLGGFAAWRRRARHQAVPPAS